MNFLKQLLDGCFMLCGFSFLIFIYLPLMLAMPEQTRLASDLDYRLQRAKHVLRESPLIDGPAPLSGVYGGSHYEFRFKANWGYGE
ncbi:unnamed protein product [Ceratitis capitata]|uniref:(Mediterranean fruit fly) hypothetical protein n=1 Tax=Ceratitis capitata TaxID=7213 RepID=A0A811TYR6_CERCA|nr:unnamed protein product [Ceratitis capitata]